MSPSTALTREYSEVMNANFNISPLRLEIDSE